MAQVILSLVTFFSLQAFASGSLSLEPSYDPARARFHYSLGLGVYQTITPMLAYSSWTGLGNDLFSEEGNYHSWYVSKHQIEIKVMEDLTISPGVKLNFLDDQETGYKKRLYGEALAKIVYKIW